VGLSTRLARLGQRHAPTRPGYPPPAFSDAHMAESLGHLAEAMGADALLADLAERLGGAVPAELEALVRERGGRQHAIVAE
jgi:hypothetical protein